MKENFERKILKLKERGWCYVLETEQFLSKQFLSWFEEHFAKSLTKGSYSLYLHYAEAFANFIQKDFLDYNKKDADYYCGSLKHCLSDGTLKPKSVHNQIGILASIARELESSKDIPDYFSSQERPEIEYPDLSVANLPSTQELDTILSAANEYDSSGIMHAALLLIGLYALSRSEIIALSTENVFIQDNSLAIKRKECKLHGVTLPKMILLDAGTYNKLLPFYEKMKERAEHSANKEPVHLFTTFRGEPIKPSAFSYSFRCIMKQTNLSYTLRELRAGALTRIAQIGGSDALYETVGLRSVWGERYVAAARMLSAPSSSNHSTNAYDNFIMLPRDNTSTVFETLYHLFQSDECEKTAFVEAKNGTTTATITIGNEKPITIDENGIKDSY